MFTSRLLGMLRERAESRASESRTVPGMAYTVVAVLNTPKWYVGHEIKAMFRREC